MPEGLSNPGVSQAALDAVSATVPVPATVTPPGVADTSTAGSASPYARADHTHASKARKQRMTGISTATFTWVYSTPFPAGVVPICNGIAEDPVDSALDSYNVQISGVPTNTQCVFRVKRQTSGLFGLLTGAIGFNPAPGTINVHCTALEP